MPFKEINASQLFLTYPHCTMAKEDALAYLQRTLHIIRYLVCVEQHADGSPHLHMYLKLDSSYPHRFRNCRFADLVDGGHVFHGNYQGARSVNAVITYVKKGSDFITNIDLDKYLKSKVDRAVVAASLLKNRQTLVEVVEEHPQLLFGYTRLKIDFANFLQDKETAPDLPPFLPNPWALVLSSNKQGKQRHYWIFSDKPNVGKTYHFARPLSKDFGAVIQSGDFTYWSVRNSTRCLVLDEYNVAKLKYSELNSMCDGTFGYRIFMAGLLKLNDPLIIVLSNVSIRTLYPNMYELLYSRFKEIKLD